MKDMPMGLYGKGDSVAIKANRVEVTAWCVENKIGAFFYGHFMITGYDYWIVSNDEHRVMFMLRWT
jgi:hypothetical protein